MDTIIADLLILTRTSRQIQKKNRNVGTFVHQPLPQPCAVCFDIKGSRPGHADVLREINKLQRIHPEVVIEKVVFIYRSLENNLADMDNRWIITTNSVTSRNRLAGSQIKLFGQESQLRRYDDVITSEYQQYRRMMDFVKMMNHRLGVKDDKVKGGGDKHSKLGHHQGDSNSNPSSKGSHRRSKKSDKKGRSKSSHARIETPSMLL